MVKKQKLLYSKAQSEGLGSSVVQALEKENDELKAKITSLQEKAIKDNDAANARLTLFIQSQSQTPPTSYTVNHSFPVSSFCVAYHYVDEF